MTASKRKILEITVHVHYSQGFRLFSIKFTDLLLFCFFFVLHKLFTIEWPAGSIYYKNVVLHR